MSRTHRALVMLVLCLALATTTTAAAQPSPPTTQDQNGHRPRTVWTEEAERSRAAVQLFRSMERNSPPVSTAASPAAAPPAAPTGWSSAASASVRAPIRREVLNRGQPHLAALLSVTVPGRSLARLTTDP
jgi:hypothetical protein